MSQLQSTGHDDPADYVNLPVDEVREIEDDLTNAGMARGHVAKLMRALTKKQISTGHNGLPRMVLKLFLVYPV